jgi:hypothetical protein
MSGGRRSALLMIAIPKSGLYLVCSPDEAGPIAGNFVMVGCLQNLGYTTVGMRRFADQAMERLCGIATREFGQNARMTSTDRSCPLKRETRHEN